MKRLTYWRAAEARAFRALSAGEWWNGRTWRPADTYPRTRAEGAAYRTAHDRLAEIIDAMIGGDDEATRLKKATRLQRSASGRRKVDARKDEAHDAWQTLVVWAKSAHVDLLAAPLNKQLLDSCVAELTRGRYTTRFGAAWTRDGVKSFLRRRRLGL